MNFPKGLKTKCLHTKDYLNIRVNYAAPMDTIGYEGGIRVKQKGGSSFLRNDTLYIKDASKILLLSRPQKYPENCEAEWSKGFLKKELDAVRKTIIINGALNSKIPGKSAYEIAKLAGVNVPEDTKILIGEVESVDIAEEFAHEKLSPVLAMYKAKTFEEAIEEANILICDGGHGPVSYTHLTLPTKRIV